MWDFDETTGVMLRKEKETKLGRLSNYGSVMQMHQKTHLCLFDAFIASSLVIGSSLFVIHCLRQAPRYRTLCCNLQIQL